jgi:ubiquinone/menaquinone biosynthesis C-methylase UbiE
MPTTELFEKNTDRYEQWFDTHEHAYRSERAALERHVPGGTDGIEIGVGTGRFAAPLGMQVGVDPSSELLSRAASRGVTAIGGVAEALPFGDRTFDTALMVTTICFVDDIRTALHEARRVLRPNGQLVVGYVDAKSPLGERYRERTDENPFYADATFVATDGLVEQLETVGFGSLAFSQTLFDLPEERTEPAPVRDGYGDGSFVAVRASR